VQELFTRAFRPFWIMAGLASGLVGAALAVPAAQALMKFALPAPGALGLVLAAVAAITALAWRLRPGRP
jgi:MFS superfamily sulfate permease-like transporter